MPRLLAPALPALACCALVTAAVSGCAAPAPSVPLAATLFVNGHIATVDDAFSFVEAVAVDEGGRIAATGTTRELQTRRGPNTVVVDFGGRTVLPGFIDTHLHVRGDPDVIDVANADSIATLKARLAERAAKMPPGQWIRGIDWSEDTFAEHRRPTRQDIDEVVSDRPVFLWRGGAHSGVANSAALKLAGITRATPDPADGIIERDAKGEPTGILREKAQQLVRALIPPLSNDDKARGYEDSVRAMLPLGITGYINAGSVPDDLPLFRRIYAAYGAELPRGVLQIRIDATGTPEEVAARVRALPFHTGDGDDRLKIGALKVLVDGGYTGAAAYTLVAYKGQPGYFGQLQVPGDTLRAIAREALARGWQVGFHTIGDGAIKVTTEAFSAALDENPKTNHRFYLNHFTVMPPPETIALLARHHILVAQQPNFTYTLAGRYAAHLEGERLARNNPLRTLLDAKVHLAFGSDNLPIDPMLGLHAAVNRTGMDGQVYGVQERLTLPEAVRAYTRDAAYVSFDEERRGSIAPGRFADMIVLETDPFAAPPASLKDIKVTQTIVGGRAVWTRQPAARVN